ncbi:uncharacterized protein LOC129737607 [Uranotaenia lowii]|uniref:uncharacterized protein LOC129737607 n=1 Tax=Uranotaenia lowii TaxID=190385 RepID=UPI00247A7A2C|nr:uncharacterized protein LOC129737607 [Uranotaenia lowii]
MSDWQDDLNADLAKKKWKNLCDTFSKELRKIVKCRSGDACRLNFKAYTTWPYFESMMFLRHQLAMWNCCSRKAWTKVFYIRKILELQNIHGTHSRTQVNEDRISNKCAQQQLVDVEARKRELLEEKTNRKTNPEDEDDADFF